MEDKLFSIILTHYNQMEYIGEALKSIFEQDYPNIELIITDDASKDFDKQKIEKLINKYKKGNIKQYKIIQNKENLGTVKTLNKALDVVKGEYISFFAADDKLYNEHVFSNYVKSFDKYNTNIVTAQAYLYDENMDKLFESAVNIKEAIHNNSISAFNLFEKMSISCIYSAGATCYKKCVFEKYGKFEEDYKLVEDWTYWLKITRLGEKMTYVDFPSLKHRDGGVSHNNEENIPPHVAVYYNDLLMAYKKLIMPYIKEMTFENQMEIIIKYLYHIYIFGERVNSIKEEYCDEKANFFDIYKIDKSQYDSYLRSKKQKEKIYNFIKWQIIDRNLHPLRYNKVISLSILLWLIMIYDLSKNTILIDNLFALILSFAMCATIMDITNKHDRFIPYSIISCIMAFEIFRYVISNLFVLLLVLILVFIISYYLIMILSSLRSRKE